ncbi:MAG: hypothetical protein QOF02_3150 [Blastocatellia bacterium]|jgi:hypothetical protein|nr:hypothetical protein [Blastocatellia bacterium]
MNFRRCLLNTLSVAAAQGFALAAFTLSLLLLLPLASYAQETAARPAPKPVAPPLESLLNQAAERTLEYTNVFKDLMAEERQTVELYDPSGQLMRQRRLLSDFVVYQSQLKSTLMVEYRHVREVDGVTVADQEQRAINLFERLVKVDSVSKELDRIDREGSRYDLSYSIKGYTLNQGMALQREVREAFEFRETGRETIDGHEVVVLTYRQIAQHPLLKFNLSLPKAKAAPLYRGRLWLDAATAQLWREEREIIIRLPKFIDPIPVIRFEFQYAPSKFKILTPQRITFSTVGSIKKVEGHAPLLAPGGRVQFEYGTFEIFDVSVKPNELTPQRPQ